MLAPDGGAVNFAPKIFCRACASPLVQATDWAQDEEARWAVRLWCPECGSERSALLDKSEAGFLSLAIEAGFAALLEALEQFQELESAAELDLVTRIRSEHRQRR